MDHAAGQVSAASSEPFGALRDPSSDYESSVGIDTVPD